MRILVLDDNRADRIAIEAALKGVGFDGLGVFEPPTPPPSEDGRLTFADWTLDAATRDLCDAGRRATLTSAEFDLLLAFLRRPGAALSRADLTRALRGRPWDYFDRSIDTLVARLRKKIDTPGAPSLIRSVRGVGYVLCAAVSRQAGPPP